MIYSIISGVLRLTLRHNTLVTITNVRFTGMYSDATELSFLTFGSMIAMDSTISS